MLKSFTRNHEDNSTEAGFEFTFYCDICQDGYRSSFIESETYKKRSGLRGLTMGASVLQQPHRRGCELHRLRRVARIRRAFPAL